jgi:glycogen debranching enzyme
VAYNLSKHYLSKLVTENGVLAGYPWFPQVWTRDELISLKGLMLSGNKPYVKESVLRYIEQVQFDGRLPNHFDGTEKNSDSAGWFFRRALDLIGGNIFDGKELLLLNERCRTASACLDKYFRKGGLINSPAGSTWMDSLERAGARLEIQAFDYSLFELLKQLTRDTEFLKQQHRLARLVKSEFFKSNYLWDAPDDATIRPNIFLAAYAAPRLLRAEEWGKCIRKALKALWNEWGGLATIDKSSPNFQIAHTGENPLSYHNGDSWFFVNNLAGVAMSRMKGFSRHTRRILEASTSEILRHGCMGCHGELSSSGKLDSAGTWLQAWSSATYIELVEALEKLE